jgi:hypothetical protein
MPTTAPAAGAATAGPAVDAALPLDVLARVCCLLPRGDLAFIAPRLCKALAAALAPQIQAARVREMPSPFAWWDDLSGDVAAFSIPLWAMQEAWPRLQPQQQRPAAERAACHGDIPALRWALERLGGGEHDSICLAAARGGQLEALQCARAQWARAQEPPCPWDASTCEEAARGGHLAVLQWARAQEPPCPWDDGTCWAAAEDGHLAVLQWARAQEPPCPWADGTCAVLESLGRLGVAQWARAQGLS